MKILIVTIWDTGNLGNRLQNYALQEVLKAEGHEVFTSDADYRPKKISLRKRCVRQCKIFVKHVLALLGSKKYRIELKKRRTNQKNLKQRKKLGKEFSKKYIPNIEHVKYIDKIDFKDLSSYDLAVAGSDQIWHVWRSYIPEQELHYFSLEYLPYEKRIAYAGSIGRRKEDIEFPDILAKTLKSYRAISTRESGGAEIIKELTGRDAPVVLDPSLLLMAEQWEKIEERPKFLDNGDYVLSYALGPQNDEYKKTLENYKSQGYKIIETHSKELPIGPSEFVYLIHHAKAIVTDSFHGTAFSIIFHKEVHVFQRRGMGDMSDRIVSLANAVGLGDKLENGPRLLVLGHDVDFKKVEEKLTTSGDYSLAYLKDALAGKES